MESIGEFKSVSRELIAVTHLFFLVAILQVYFPYLTGMYFLSGLQEVQKAPMTFVFGVQGEI